MAQNQFGTTLSIGAGTLETAINTTALSVNYCIISDTSGGNETRFEDTFSGVTGERCNRTYFNKDEKITLELVTHSGATPKTDFPEHAKCTVNGLTSYLVENCTIAETAGGAKVSVTLVNRGV